MRHALIMIMGEESSFSRQSILPTSGHAVVAPAPQIIVLCYNFYFVGKFPDSD